MVLSFLKVSQRLLKVPRHGALEAYFGNIMASSFPKASQMFLNLAVSEAYSGNIMALNFSRDATQRSLKGFSTWRPGGIPAILRPRVSQQFPEGSSRFPNLAPRRHTLAILWLRVSQKFPEGSSRFPNLAPQRHTLAISWLRVSQKFPEGFSRFLDLAPRRHTLA